MAANDHRPPEVEFLSSTGLNWQNNAPNTEALFLPILDFAYGTLAVLNGEEEGTFTIQSNIFNMPQADFTAQTQNIARRFGITKSLPGAYNLYKMACHYPLRMTRDVATTLLTRMDNVPLNTAMKNLARQLKGTPLAPNITVWETFTVTLSHIVQPLTFLYKKSIIAGRLYSGIKIFNNQVKILKTKVTNMLMDLSDRTEVNTQAAQVTQTRQQCIDLFNEYINLIDLPARNILEQQYLGWIEHRNVFSYTALRDLVIRKSVFNNNFYFG